MNLIRVIWPAIYSISLHWSIYDKRRSRARGKMLFSSFYGRFYSLFHMREIFLWKFALRSQFAQKTGKKQLNFHFIHVFSLNISIYRPNKLKYPMQNLILVNFYNLQFDE